MANKPKSQKPTDVNVKAAEELIKFGREQVEAEILKLKTEIETTGDEREAIGVLKKIRADRTYNDLVEAIVLYRMKKNKTHIKLGFPWAKFCDAAGIHVNTADYKVDSIKKLYDDFSTNIVDLFGLKLSDIKLLGEAKSTNIVDFKGDTILYKGQEMPLSEVQTVLDDIKDELRNLREAKDAEIKNKENDFRAKDRVLKQKEEQIHKLNKQIDNISALAEKKGLSPEEYGFISKMENLRLLFDESYVNHLEPTNVVDIIPNDKKEATIRMKLAYLTTLDYLAKQLNIALSIATEMFGDVRMISGGKD